MTHTNYRMSAFPCPEDESNLRTNGMTLRDYFAAKAMQGELSASVCTDDKSDYGIPLNVSDEKLDRMTKHWFRIADSMLRARGAT